CRPFHLFSKGVMATIMLCAAMSLHAQQQNEVSGTVLSAVDQMPLPGVTVRVKGTSTGTVTDFDGNYTIPITGEDDILVFSYVGFKTEEIAVNGQARIGLSMQEDRALLDEVVVVGYGTQRRQDLTGAVSVVKAEELQKTSTNDVGQ